MKLFKSFQDIDGNTIDLPVGKVICVGQNYAEHIQEMASTRTRSPMLFMKPNTSLVDASLPIEIPIDKGECHNEIEVALLVKQTINRHTVLDVESQIWGVGLALDLTLRDIQAKCKQKGHPWEKSKSFDGSCPISSFIPVSPDTMSTLSFQLDVNGVTRQSGNTSNMIFDIETLLNEIKSHFTLLPGDIVLTGTPKGVAPLFSGDSIAMKLENKICVNTEVVTCL
ncbi:fumarylacetoacetate hydrolase family protein [Alteromonas sp. 5E99-2]|uniref:fumarylacetoacetate hydrolase family protein n=1 Tax=Alteromonas sp. 5E99-2 TaxID=2817683 RepID=UPI001A988358|nr:fumarylacetoacetate hydrolase family protein [Alteromonas sp. 5E99-2]MBO1255145.1 fumarylacetoacetate hydrolase family protein [Alteromonas sp. 5E99-2]